MLEKELAGLLHLLKYWLIGVNIGLCLAAIGWGGYCAYEWWKRRTARIEGKRDPARWRRV